MLKDNELAMIGHFRRNARMSLTQLSRLTKIPVSTIFDKLKEYERNSLITKHTCLLDFRKLGYDVRTQMLITAAKDTKEKMQRFLVQHPRINTVFRVNNGYDFLVEAVFRDMHEMDTFTRALDEYVPREKREFFIMEDIKREEFLTHKENMGMMR